MTTDTQRLQVLILNMTIITIIIAILNMIIDTLQLGLEFTIINVSTPIATTITTNVVPNLHQQSPIICARSGSKYGGSPSRRPTPSHDRQNKACGIKDNLLIIII